MKFLRVLILFSLIGSILPQQGTSQDSPLLIQSVELIRRGQQVTVHLLTNGPPVYEVNENLPAKTLVIKFQNARLDFVDGRNERLFNDEQIAGIRFNKVDDAIWAQFKLRLSELSYEIVPRNEGDGIAIVLRPPRKVAEVDEEILPLFELSSVALESGKAESSTLRFNFIAAPSRGSLNQNNDALIPRIFLLESADQNLLTVRFPETLPMEGLELSNLEDSRIRYLKIRPEVNQTLVDFELSVEDLRIERTSDLQKKSWQLELFGSPLVADNASGVAELSEEEQKAAAKAERDKLRRRLMLKSMLQEAENAFRDGLYNEAVKLFQAVYAQGKADSGEFDEPLEPLAMQAMFRAADVLYTMLERSRGNNHHRSIDAFKTAVRIVEMNQKPDADENSSSLESFIPHAKFRIARSYQKMQFHSEASQYFEQLRQQFPNSMEAVEAIFWKAVTQVDRRNWGQAIENFKEYLRTSPAPKHLAVTHYKLAQAYYQQGRFITAREHFDTARDLNTAYVRQDPTLLFHMGETYYENADYTTAREVFKMLLRLYPKADFSKFVALRLGDFLRDEGKEDEAIVAYRNAIDSYSREIALLGKLRIANIQSQRPFSSEYLKALKAYEDIITLYPESEQAEEALLMKGLTLTLYGFYQQAIDSLEKFMDRYPQSVYVRRNVIQESIDENLKGLIDQHFRNQDDLALVAAYRDYKTKYMLNFRFDTTLFQASVAHNRLGLFDDALDIQRFLDTRASGTMGELNHLETGRTLYEKKDYPAARNKLAQFLQQYPESVYDADARMLLARVYRKNKEFSKALIVYEQTIEKYDQDQDPLKAEIVPELYYDTAQMLEEAGYFSEAADAYLQAVKRYNHPVTKPDTPLFIIHSHFLAGEMLYKVQNNESALAQFEKTIGLYENRQEPEIRERIHWAHYHRGNLYAQQGQEEKALKIYKDLIDSPEGEGSLWKKMAIESYQSLARQMSYQNYLNQ